MKRPTLSALNFLVLAGLLLAVITAMSSVTAKDCKARVTGGTGTVHDPLQIEVEGNAGLLPFIDSLLPFRGIPAIQLSYVGERFYVPGINPLFNHRQPLAHGIALVAILLLLVLSLHGALRLAGKRIAIIDRHPER